jgi:hypothetical protein
MLTSGGFGAAANPSIASPGTCRLLSSPTIQTVWDLITVRIKNNNQSGEKSS